VSHLRQFSGDDISAIASLVTGVAPTMECEEHRIPCLREKNVLSEFQRDVLHAMNNSNPYDSPEIVTLVPRMQSDHPPRLCIVMFGFSLLLCFLRIPFLALAIMEESGGGMGYDPAFMITAIPGIATSSGIVVFGLAGNTLLLARIRWGIPLAVLLVLSTITSIGVEIWVTMLARSLPNYRGGVPHDVASVAVTLFRLILLGLYVSALNGFTTWSRHRSADLPR